MPNIDRDAEQVTCYGEAAPPPDTVTIDRAALTSALRRHEEARRAVAKLLQYVAGDVMGLFLRIDEYAVIARAEAAAYAALLKLLEVSDNDCS